MAYFRKAQRGKEFLENLVDAVREPMVVLDQALGVLFASRAFYSVFQVGPRETIGRMLQDLGDGQWNLSVLTELLEAVLSNKVAIKDFEISQVFPQIGKRTMLLNAQQIASPLGKNNLILLAIDDITSRAEFGKSAETSLLPMASNKIAEDNARELVNSIIDTIREPFLVLNQDLHIIGASRAFYEVFKFRPEEVLGLLIFELGNGRWNTDRMRELLDALLLQSSTFQDFEIVHTDVGLGRRTVLVNARQVRKTLGLEQVILLALEDVTDRKVIEAELQKIDRMGTLGILAGGIAHDFNNLMAGLLATNEVVMHHLKKGNPEIALERINKTPEIFARGRALTQRLLTFSKGGGPVRAPRSLAHFLPEWVEFAMMGSDVTVSLTIDPDLWVCDCDIAQIGQVINNLLINARQASAANELITVSASNVVKMGGYISLKVVNLGLAISPTIIGKIFDPFFTTKTTGSGLGLSIALSIVKQHGGWIDVVSNDLQGTSFTVFLPSTTLAQSVVSPQSCGDFAGTGLALVMDDDPDVLDTVGEMVALLGFEVYRCNSGADALKTYEEIIRKGKKVTFFLLDNQIPGGIGGVATGESLRKLGCLAQIVIMSGHFDTPPGAVVSETNNLWRLAKPFSRDELCNVLMMTPSPL